VATNLLKLPMRLWILFGDFAQLLGKCTHAFL
jgi:hypothetical protein